MAALSEPGAELRAQCPPRRPESASKGIKSNEAEVHSCWALDPI